MDPIAWLRDRHVGFPTEQQGELLKAITDFALLWSFFEGMVLGTNGRAPRIVRRVGEWHTALGLEVAEFAGHLEYFRNRYCPNGVWNAQYDMLRMLGEDEETLVRRVLERQTEDAVACVSGVLLMVLRIRNNLFHGRKVYWGFADQAENFQRANLALMCAWEVEQRARDAGLAPMAMAA